MEPTKRYLFDENRSKDDCEAPVWHLGRRPPSFVVKGPGHKDLGIHSHDRPTGWLSGIPKTGYSTSPLLGRNKNCQTGVLNPWDKELVGLA